MCVCVCVCVCVRACVRSVLSICACRRALVYMGVCMNARYPGLSVRACVRFVRFVRWYVYDMCQLCTSTCVSSCIRLSLCHLSGYSTAKCVMDSCPPATIIVN